MFCLVLSSLTSMHAALVIRVLYRLRTLSEQRPFDAATYGYASPLLSQVLLKGSIAIGEEDDPLEQIALSLDIIKFHCGECASLLHFPCIGGDADEVQSPTCLSRVRAPFGTSSMPSVISRSSPRTPRLPSSTLAKRCKATLRRRRLRNSCVVRFTRRSTCERRVSRLCRYGDQLCARPSDDYG